MKTIYNGHEIIIDSVNPFNELEKVRKSLNIDQREHDPEYAWCEECQDYYHESTHLWKGDLALCPKCESNLEI